MLGRQPGPGRLPSKCAHWLSWKDPPHLLELCWASNEDMSLVEGQEEGQEASNGAKPITLHKLYAFNL